MFTGDTYKMINNTNSARTVSLLLLLVMDIDRRGSSITDVMERAGVKDRLDLLFPLTANKDLLRLLLLLPNSAGKE